MGVHLYALGIREARQNLASPLVAFYRWLVIDLFDAQESARNLMALTACEGSRTAVVCIYILWRASPFSTVKRDILTPANPPFALSDVTGVQIVIGLPLSKPGDFIDLRAEVNLVVGVITACSVEKSNNYNLKSIDLNVIG